MDASIIVCTYNRADSLSETLDAIKAQLIPPNVNWELIVVDNNSKDHTKQVVEKAQSNFKTIRYIFENKQGLSNARNRGISVAEGDVILFTDDDVLPEADWLEQTLLGLNKYQAKACGGYISPIWETSPPNWLSEHFYGFLALRTNRNDDYIITQASDAPFGANMAFRREVFEELGFFDTSRGRKGNSLASGEDGEFFQRILSAGLTTVFIGKSRVHHKIEKFRLTKKYFRRWRFETSRNIAESCGIEGARRLFNIPLYIFHQFLWSLIRMSWARFSCSSDEAFRRELIVFHFLGLMQGLYRSQKTKEPPAKAE